MRPEDSTTVPPAARRAGQAIVGISGYDCGPWRGRFLTHDLKPRNAEASLGKFVASGVLALGTSNERRGSRG